MCKQDNENISNLFLHCKAVSTILEYVTEQVWNNLGDWGQN